MAESDQSFNKEDFNTPRYCSNCGERLVPGSNFCGMCGTETSPNNAPGANPPGANAPEAVAQVFGRGMVYSDDVEYMGFWIRLAAVIIDGVITGVISAVIDFVLDTAFLGTIFTVLYSVLFIGLKGQTPGKMALGIQVVDSQGNPPGIMRAFLREVVGKLVSTVVIFLGFFWIIWDRKKRGWHDHIAGTFVARKKR